MDEEVHEVYDAEIPDEPVMEDALAEVDMSCGNADKLQVQDAIKMRLNEEEAAELREELVKIEEKDAELREKLVKLVEKDAELREKLAKVEKKMDDVQHPSWNAAIQTSWEEIDSLSMFDGNEIEANPEAVLLNGSELNGCLHKVSPKRTNIPWMKQYCGRYLNPYMGYRPYCEPVYFNSPYDGYGKAPRFCMTMRHRPYS